MRLTINFYLLFIFILTTNFAKAMSLSEIIPQGFEIRDSVSGNLNNDAYQDMIIVLKRTDEDSISKVSEFAIKRETLILYGTSSGFTIKARNFNVVYCVNCGGPMGDPYVGMKIENNKFSISHYGGGVWRWSRVSTFSMNASGTWILEKDDNETFSTENPETTRDTIVTTPKEFGTITFEQYDIDKE